MKKNIKQIVMTMMIFCMMVISCKDVRASQLIPNTLTGEVPYITNNFSMNVPNGITYGGYLAEESNNATRLTTQLTTGYTVFYADPAAWLSPPAGMDGIRFAGNARDKGGYELFKLTSQDAYVSGVFNNVGYLLDGTQKRALNAVMTISNFKRNDDYVCTLPGNAAYVGFCQKSFSYILLNDGVGYDDGYPGERLNADIEIYFYFADDPTRKPVDMGEAYIGVGGMNSEKRLYNKDAVSDNNFVYRNRTKSNQQVHDTPELARITGILGSQWEWVSYDSSPSGELKIYSWSDVINKVVPASGENSKVNAKDYDTDEGVDVLANYRGSEGDPWPYDSGTTCTFDFDMYNPTGYGVISNAGNRYSTKTYEDIGKYDSFSQFCNDQVKKQCYMVEVPRINADAARTLLANKAMANSNRTKADESFSVYKFLTGKDTGSIEAGLLPISICNEIQNENITYTISQQVGNMNDGNQRITQQNKYNALKLVDNLPAEVDLVSATVKVGNNVVAQYNGTAQTSGADSCVISYNSANKTIECNFTYSYLQNNMSYVGETYTFVFVTKVKDVSVGQNFILSNQANTTFDNAYTIYSNEVETKILYDILTKADSNSIISSLIANINGGESGKVVEFSPKAGYFIDKVEWQTQSERYAETQDGVSVIERLLAVSDIPSNNKVTIPEVKNGATYKFVQTMDNSEGNTLNYDPFGTTTFTFNNVDNNHYVKVVSKAMTININITKEDSETGDKTQGDAKFEG